MPRRPTPLPAGTPDVFSVGQGRDLGIGRGRSRRRDLDARVHGVRIAEGSADDLRVRCRAFAARLDGEVFFSHSTAARLFGIPLPRWLERLEFLHVTVEAPRRAPHAAGLLGHSRRVAPGDVVRLGDLRVSSPERLWCEMAGVLSLADLVAVTDHLIHHSRRLATPDSLAERLEFGDRISRPRILRAALGYSSDRSESRPESHLRLACHLAGLPVPSVNHEIVDLEDGRGYRLDLAWPERRFALEYQGDGHRSRDHWRRDMSRRERLRLAGWTILELNADDLGDHAALVSLIRSRLAVG